MVATQLPPGGTSTMVLNCPVQESSISMKFPLMAGVLYQKKPLPLLVTVICCRLGLLRAMYPNDSGSGLTVMDSGAGVVIVRVVVLFPGFRSELAALTLKVAVYAVPLGAVDVNAASIIIMYSSVLELYV